VTVEPSCTAAGHTTYTCHCGDTYTEEIPALGHNVVLVESEPATCELNGYEYYACDRCGGEEYQIILEATGHDYEDGKCTACGEADPDASKPGCGSWIEDLIDKLLDEWFDKWFGGDQNEPDDPPVTEPEEPTEPSKPGYGSIFDWFFGLWN
jgi:hypothetical protein